MKSEIIHILASQNKKGILFSVIFTSLLSTGCSLSNATRISGKGGKFLGSTKNAQTADVQVNGPTADALGGGGEGAGDAGSGPAGGDASGGAGGIDPSDPTASTRPFVQPENLVWKRYRAFETTMMQALELPKNRVCNELGQFSCIDVVHLTLLGGNEPFVNGQHERAERPTVLTPVAVERVVLASCTERLNLDKSNAGQKVVFKQIDLAATTVTAEQAKGQATEFYQRFYGRDPTTEELNRASEILKLSLTPEKVALGLCFTIGTTVENVFL